MKKIKLLIASNLFLITLQAQNFQWSKREGLWAYDYGFGITTDKSGNIYTAGKYEMNAKFSGVTLPCQGNHDIYVAKYSPSGALTWIRTAGGYSGDYAWGVACDNAYVYVAGEIEGYGNTIKFVGSSITLKCKGSNDIFLAKYDLNGNLLWAISAGDFDYDKALGVTYDASGNIYICGIFTTKAVFGGTTTIYGSGDKDIFVAKYDKNGNFLWVRKAGGSGRDEAKSIKCDAAGNVYICGMYKGTATFGAQTVTAPNGYSNMYVAKYSPVGSLIWLKTAGGNYDDVAWSLTMDNAGKIYVTGEFNATINFDGIPLYTSGSADIFVTCYNSYGNVLWAKKAGGYKEDRARGIGCDGNNLYITGQFGSTASFGSFTRTAADNSDIFMACLNNTGQFLWATSVGGPADALETVGYESGIAICAEASGNVYATGALLSGGVFGSTYLSPYSRTDIFITKLKNPWVPKTNEGDSLVSVFQSFNAQRQGKNNYLTWVSAPNYGDFIIERSRDSTIFETIGTVEKKDISTMQNYYFSDTSLDNAIDEGKVYYRLRQMNKEGDPAYSKISTVIINKWSNLLIKIYPNPADNSLTISINNKTDEQQFLIIIYDASGQEVGRQQTTSYLSQIDINSFNSGIYFIEIRTEDQMVLKEKIVVQK